MKESVNKFMVYVHMSVNLKSKEQLGNERCCSYTTPKSFLEQIKLYRSLLGQKSKYLTTRIARLENGLQKLNSTSAQVQNVPYSIIYFSCLNIFFLTLIRGSIFIPSTSQNCLCWLKSWVSEFCLDFEHSTASQGPFSGCCGWIFLRDLLLKRSYIKCWAWMYIIIYITKLNQLKLKKNPKKTNWSPNLFFNIV